MISVSYCYFHIWYQEIPETVEEMVARMVAMGPASVTDATSKPFCSCTKHPPSPWTSSPGLATLPESAPATLVSRILEAAGKLYLPEEAAEIMEEGGSGEAAKNMEQANVSSVTGQSLNVTLISSKFYHYDLGFEKY